MKLQTLFKPKTMAVIGVSLTNDRHPANVIYNKNYHRYPIKVFPVNTRGGVFQSEEVFTSVSEIPLKVDLAVIVVRAEYVPDIIAKCIKAGVGSAAIISGGFAESGNKEIQRAIST